MSNTNDIELAEHINAINRNAARLNQVTADRNFFALSNLLDSIRFHAKGAIDRIGELETK